MGIAKTKNKDANKCCQSKEDKNENKFIPSLELNVLYVPLYVLSGVADSMAKNGNEDWQNSGDGLYFSV